MAKSKQKQKAKQNSLLRIGLIGAGLVFIVGGLLLLNMWKNPSGEIVGCKTTDGIRVCLETFKTSGITSSEDITVKVRATNTTTKPYEASFSVCEDKNGAANLIINGGQPRVTCTSISAEPYTLPAKKTKVDTFTVAGASLKPGANKLVGEWGGKVSETVEIARGATTQSEQENQFKKCQNLPDNIEYSKIPSYCESVTITLSSPSETNNYTCEYWKEVVAEAELAIPCADVMDIGVAYVYLPQEYVRQYGEKLKTLTNVKAVAADSL